MARRLAGRFGYPEAPHEFDVTLHHDKWREPLKWRKPRTVFVCSMSDLFHKDVDEYFRADLWSLMCGTPTNTYIVLTKRAKAMHDWIVGNKMDAPPHIWLGVTAENQHCADERIPWLMRTPAAVHFVSFEPLLSRIFVDARQANLLAGIQWAIVGAETGPGARPMDLAWARDLRDQCQQAGVPFFWKRVGPGQKTPPDLIVREWPR